VDNQPLVVTEGQEFQNLMSYLRAGTNSPSADTLRRDLDTNFVLIMEKVRQKLQVSDLLKFQFFNF
jgi:hypothetical protein